MGPYQVAFAVPFVHQIPGVATASVAVRIRQPPLVGAVVFSHQACEEVDVNVVGCEARRGTESHLECHDELIKLARHTDIDGARNGCGLRHGTDRHGYYYRR
jgi:hypothetical protein